MSLKKIYDILLYPDSFYKRLTNKRFSLIMGMIIVGIIDIGFPLYFALGGSFNVPLSRLPILVSAIVFSGVVDVVFLALPLYDLFRAISKKIKCKNVDGNLVKIMKIYIYSHFIITPVNILFYAAVLYFGNINPFVMMFLSLFGLLVMIWGAAILTKGFSVIFEIPRNYSGLVLLIGLAWEFMVGSAIGYLIDNWVMKLFTI